MLKRLILVFFGVLIAGAGVTIFIADSYLGTPKFVVINQSDLAIEARVYWREQSKDLGTLAPGGNRIFRVRDEAGMRFSAVYPDGRIVNSSHETYFTNGMTVTAIFTTTTVEVSAEL